MATTDVEKLVVQLSADIKRFENAMDKANGVANRGFKRIESRAASLDKRLSNVGAGLSRGLTAAFAAVGGLAGFKAISDEAAGVQNALNVTGLQGEALKKVFDELYASAKRYGQPLSSLADLYSSVSLKSKELGVSTERIIGLVDTVAASLQVSGKSAAESSGALLQLGQAFGSGRVAAEEYNSLLEGAPSLLQAAAAGLQEAGGSVSKLTALVKDGKVSSEALFNAIEAGAPILQEKLQGAVETLGQKFTNLRTDLVKFVSQSDAAKSAAEALGNGIDAMASVINSTEFSTFIEEIGRVVAAFKQGLLDIQSISGGFGDIDFSRMAPAPVEGGGSSFVPDFSKLNGGPESSLINKVVEDLEKRDKAAIDRNFKYFQEVSKDPSKYGPQLPSKTPAAPAPAPNFRVPGPGPQSFPLPAELQTQIKPVSLADYVVPGSKDPKGSKGGRGSKKSGEDRYGESLEEAKQHLANLREETRLQAGLNPLVNDYGASVAALKLKQDLLNEAKENEITLSPAQLAAIDSVSKAYGEATAEAAKLAESQEELKASAEEFLSLGKDVTRGFVDGLIQGKSAADLFSEALSKIGNKLLDLAFDSFFSTDGGGKSLGGLGKILGFSSGGYTGAGAKNDPAGIVHRGEYVVPKSTVDKMGVSGVESALSGGSISNAGRSSSSGGASFTFAPNIDNRGASVETVARTEAMIRKVNAEFESRTIAVIRKSGKSNVKY